MSPFSMAFKKEQDQAIRIHIGKVQNTLDMTKKRLTWRKRLQETTLINAIVAMDAQEKNMELAVKVYNSSKDKI